MAFARIACPTNWMETNGQKIPFFTNGQLDFDGFMLFVETGGALTILQDGASISVVLPDLRGDFIRGWNSGASNRPDFGRKIGSFQDQQQAPAAGVPNVAFNRSKRYSTVFGQGTAVESGGALYSEFPAKTGVDIRPRNSAFLYCMKVK